MRNMPQWLKKAIGGRWSAFLWLAMGSIVLALFLSLRASNAVVDRLEATTQQQAIQIDSLNKSISAMKALNEARDRQGQALSVAVDKITSTTQITLQEVRRMKSEEFSDINGLLSGSANSLLSQAEARARASQGGTDSTATNKQH